MMDVYSDPMPMSSQRHVAQGYLDTEKMDFLFLTPYFSLWNDFWCLIEYPFKLIFVWQMSIAFPRQFLVRTM